MSRASVRIGSVVLGEGRTKLCVPVVGATLDALRREAEALADSPADLLELRIDHFADVDDPDAVRTAIEVVRLASPLPMLFTFRTRAEGGQRDLSTDAYERLLTAVSGSVDAVDVEASTEPAALARIVAGAKGAGAVVVLSSHDFSGTPSREAMLQTLEREQALGGDVLKLAVTPASAADVLALLEVTEEFVRTRATRPVIAMSMGGLGLVSRLAGELVGSVLSFGAVGATSAPGQIGAGELATVLDLVHRELGGSAVERG